MSVSNFVRTTIKNSVSSGATTIDVDTASSPFNNPPSPDDHARLFLVDSLDSPTKWEEIEYTGRTAITGGYQLTGVTRNEDSSTGSAQSFDAGHFVVMQPSATTDGQGAIVESGTNSNGSYIRYENGEQICWHKVQLTFSNASLMDASWDFPADFNTAPIVNHTLTISGYSASPSGDMLGGSFVSSSSTNSVNLRQYRQRGQTDFSSGDTADTYAQAVGFWK